MSYMKNAQASLKSLVETGIVNIAGYGAPTDGTSGTGLGVSGKGSLYFDATNSLTYQNTGTAASPTWTLISVANIAAGTLTSAMMSESVLKIAEVAITKANILAMFGAEVTVVAAPGAGKVIQFVSGVLIYDYATATYGAGGDVTLNYAAGAAVSTTITAANSFGAAGDKVFSFGALNAAGGYTMPSNTGLSIKNATAAFTDPGTAAGVGRLKIAYRVITTDL